MRKKKGRSIDTEYESYKVPVTLTMTERYAGKFKEITNNAKDKRAAIAELKEDFEASIDRVLAKIPKKVANAG